MTREKIKQVQDVIESINAKYNEWQARMDSLVEMADYEVPMPSLPKMVESLLLHLQGLDAKKAREFEWMMIV